MTRSRSETQPGHELTTGFYDPIAAGHVLPPSGQPVLNADGSLLLPGAAKALPATSVAALKDAPALIVIAHGIPQVVHLKQGKRITLGRDKTCDIMLAEVAASRRHAEVFPSPDGFYIRDLGSANGVIVNEAKIDNPYLLVHNDRITIGGIVIYFMHVRQEDQQGAVANAGQTLACRNCGASNISIARFCATCGTPLGTSNAVTKG
jgi:hypothetical protein